MIADVKIINNEIFNNNFEGIAIGYNTGPVEIVDNNIHSNKGAAIIVYDDNKFTNTEAKITNNQISGNGDDILFGGQVKIFKQNNAVINNGQLDLADQIIHYKK